jgi:uncharacterized protein YacL
MKTKIGKYIFAQTSGVVVGLVSASLLVLIIRKLKPSFLDLTNTLSLIVFTIIILLVFVFTMTLWGKVLVARGLLTKEEAKGYPYSKPWLDK